MAEEVPIFCCEGGVCYYYLQWTVQFGMFYLHVANKRLVEKDDYLTLNEKSDLLQERYN